MPKYKVEGKLLRKYEINWESQTYPVREFVLEIVEGTQPEYVKFHLIGENCPHLDEFEEGAVVKVYFELRGSESEGKYLNTLTALRLLHGGFKYQSDFDKHSLSNCPPSHYRELKMTGYRFVFEDLAHKNNFMPTALIKPERINSARDMASKCKLLGLSLYQDTEGAKANFREWVEKKGDAFAEMVGTHLAAVELEDDGLCSEPNAENFSHFTFHEFAHADLLNKVGRIEKI